MAGTQEPSKEGRDDEEAENKIESDAANELDWEEVVSLWPNGFPPSNALRKLWIPLVDRFAIASNTF